MSSVFQRWLLKAPIQKMNSVRRNEEIAISQSPKRGGFTEALTMATQSSCSSDSMELLIAYYKNPSVVVRNQLVQLNAGLVRKMAHRVSYQCAEPYEDLEQLGYLGLIRAIERFNPNQGYAFSSFAVPYIRGEMLHYLRDRSGVMKMPRRWQEIQQEGQKARKELAQTLGRSPKEAEIAQAIKVSLEEWSESKVAAQNCRPLSLDSVVFEQSDFQVTLAETLPDPRYHSWQSQEEERQELEGAMSHLDNKTQAAIELVLVRDLPRKEAAKRIGVSPMTVTRHLQRGVEQLVSLLQPQSTERLAS